MLASATLALLSTPAVLLSRRGRPTSAMAWLFALFALPLFGLLAWWLFGNERIHLRGRQRVARVRRFAAEHQQLKEDAPRRLRQLLPEAMIGRRIYISDGNRSRLLGEGEAAITALEQAISEARESIHLLFYIWRADETGLRIRDRLIEKARAGVAVRVLVDAIGTFSFSRKLRRPLEAAGAKVSVFMRRRLLRRSPRVNFANHRKLVVIDHLVAFTGGMNLGDEYSKKWRDMMVRLEGDVAKGLEEVFAADWYAATCEELTTHLEPPGPMDDDAEGCCAVVASGPDVDHSPIEDSYFLAITQARRRIFIATPYFIPSPAISMALRTAASRGVDVRIVVPARPDVPLMRLASRPFFSDLVPYGVSVLEYQPSMMHAKALLVDDDQSWIGTANFDQRSMTLSFEVSVLQLSRAANRELATWFVSVMASCRRIEKETLANQSRGQRVLESAAHLVSPLL